MAGVGEDGQCGEASFEFYGEVPHGCVAVELLIDAGEAPVYGPEACDAGGVEAQQGTCPQFYVGVHGILHQHRHIHTAQRVGQCLHAEGVDARACTHPQHVDAGAQGSLHMFGRGHLGGGEHACLGFHALHPRQCLDAFALESSGLGAWFPHSGSEDAYAVVGELCGSVHDLFLGLGRAGSCDDDGALWVHALQGEGLDVEFYIHLL